MNENLFKVKLIVVNSTT